MQHDPHGDHDGDHHQKREDPPSPVGTRLQGGVDRPVDPIRGDRSGADVVPRGFALGIVKALAIGVIAVLAIVALVLVFTRKPA